MFSDLVISRSTRKGKVCLGGANPHIGNLWLPCVFLLLRTQRLESLWSGALQQFCSAPSSARFTLLFSFLTHNFYTAACEIFQRKQSKARQSKLTNYRARATQCFQRADRLSLLYFKMHIMYK